MIPVVWSVETPPAPEGYEYRGTVFVDEEGKRRFELAKLAVPAPHQATIFELGVGNDQNA